MSPATLDLNIPTLSLLEQIILTLAFLEADPRTAAYAPPFEALYQDDWMKVALAEFAHFVEAFRADALVTAADDGLDDFVDDLDKVLLRIVKGNREDPLYAYYFGSKRPHLLKRPVLSDQYETMKAWIVPLKSSPDAELAALGVRLEGLIAKADAALVKQATASEKIKTFRTIGQRKALIDKTNALRKLTGGELGEIPHAQPDARLPKDFWARFFKHSVKRVKTAAKEVTSIALRAQIDDLKEQMAALEIQYADVLTKEEAEAAAAAQVEADKAALAAAEKEMAEAAARVAALKAKVEGK